MSSVHTPINQYQWRVPVPEGIDLEHVRLNLVSLGAEYVWLDLLCLRQDETNLGQKQEEWKLDVPTIGNIYRAAERIVRYFNGLGIPFSNEGWGDDRHWLRKAWTLQEITAEHTTINGHISNLEDPANILNIKGIIQGREITLRHALRPVFRLAKEVNSDGGCRVYHLVREMARRKSTMPVDKLAGLFYLLRTSRLPCYDAGTADEEVWRQCFHVLPMSRKIEILTEFPYRGSQNGWFPTWARMMQWPERDPLYEHSYVEWPQDHLKPSKGEDTKREESIFIPNVWTVSGAILRRRGYTAEYDVICGNKTVRFYHPYLDQEPIDSGTKVTLAAINPDHDYNWLICEAMGKEIGGHPRTKGEVEVLKKVGLLKTDGSSQLLVGGPNGVSVLQKKDCLFI